MISISIITILTALGIGVLALVMYWPCRKGPLLLDDMLWVKHPAAQKTSDWRHAFRMIYEQRTARPLSWFSFAFNAHWWGGVATDGTQTPIEKDRALYGFHIVNIGLHFACALTLWNVFSLFILSWAALLAALLFTAHSLASSAVCYVSGRYSVLASLFGFIAVGLMLSGHPLLSSLAVGVACFAKEDSVAIFGTVALIGFVNAVPFAWTALIPAVIGGIWKREPLLSLLSKTGDEGQRQIGNTGALPSFSYQFTALAELVRQLPLWIFGLKHCPDPDVKTRSGSSPWLVLAVFIISSTLYLVSGHPILMTAWLWIMASPLLVYLVIPVPDPVFEYRAYFSVGGMALLLGYSLSFFPAIVGLTAVAGFGIRTWNRATDHADGERFWLASMEEGGRRDRGLIWLGYAALENGDRVKSRAYYAEALTVNPDLAIARSNLALMDEHDGNLVDGIAGLEETLQRSPEFYQGWYYLGTMLEKAKRLDEADSAYRRSVAIQANWAVAWNRLGLITAVYRSDMKSAIPYFKNAMDYDSRTIGYRYNYAIALQLTGQPDEARPHLETIPANTPLTDQMLIVKENAA